MVLLSSLPRQADSRQNELCWVQSGSWDSDLAVCLGEN